MVSMTKKANTTDPSNPNGSSLTTHCRLQTEIVADVHNLHLVHLLDPMNQYNIVIVPEICDANGLLVNLMRYSGVLRESLLVTVDVTYNALVSDISCILCCYLDTLSTYSHNVAQRWHIKSSRQLNYQLFLHRIQLA
jgi:hypothetical protein